MGRGALSDVARVVAGIGAFLNGYSKGQQQAIATDEAKQDAQVRKDVAQVAGDFTPRETPVASGEEALTAATQAKQSALSNAPDDSARQQVEQDFAPALSALEATRANPAGVVRSIGSGSTFQQREAPFTADEVGSARSMAMAGVYERAGRFGDAGRVMQNEARRRMLADDMELRAAMAPSTAADSTGAAPTQSAVQSAVAVQGADGIVQEGRDRQASDAYYQRKVPQVIDTYLKQGKVDEAKKFRDFVDSDSGRTYAEKWSRGVRKLAIGDHQGALNDWQDLYNRQLFDDGRTVKLAPSEDGKQVTATFFGKDGKQDHATTQPIDAFVRQAGLALAPEKLVEFRAQQQAKREAEAATLDRQIQLEQLRQQGQEVREDRRDERLATRLAAQGRRGGLTAVQERSNAEIDAARDMVGSMDPAEIRRRSQKATNTGRENPDFDPAIARAANLAGRRKIGGDDYFDERRASPKPAAEVADIAGRFSADQAMKGHRLGGLKPQGREVLDQSGKLIGYYR